MTGYIIIIEKVAIKRGSIVAQDVIHQCHLLSNSVAMTSYLLVGKSSQRSDHHLRC